MTGDPTVLELEALLRSTGCTLVCHPGCPSAEFMLWVPKAKGHGRDRNPCDSLLDVWDCLKLIEAMQDDG